MYLPTNFCLQGNLVNVYRNKKWGYSCSSVDLLFPTDCNSFLLCLPPKNNRVQKKGKILENTISPSGFWLLPVLDIMDGPILFINHEDKQLDSEVYFEPYYRYFLLVDQSYPFTFTYYPLSLSFSLSLIDSWLMSIVLSLALCLRWRRRLWPIQLREDLSVDYHLPPNVLTIIQNWK